VSSDLRLKKKLATYHALATAARTLSIDKGPDAVTVEEIAETAGVSPRTFFNYFSCKEEAIVGSEPTMIAALAERVEHRPPEEDPLTALASVLAAGEHSDLAERWKLRMELTRRFPELTARHLAGAVQLERALSEAVARRLGVDPDADPYPRLVVAAAVATLRSTMGWWLQSDQSVPLKDAIQRGFEVLRSGLGRPIEQPALSSGGVA
jgi:AcrR family transcriptional regulator